MSWLDAAWTMMASASLMLGLIHLFVWHEQRSRYAHLVFFALASSVAVYGLVELIMVRARTQDEYWVALRALQIPLTILSLSILAFVRLDFGAGKLWLALMAGSLRVLVTVVTLSSGTTPQFQALTSIDHATWWGADFSSPVGPPSHWLLVTQLSNLLVIAFVVDAAVALWRRGGPTSKRRAWVVGGALVVCIVAAASLNSLLILGVLKVPAVLMPCFLLLILAMGYELSLDVINAAKLSNELREREQQIELAALGANLAFWSWDARTGSVWLSERGRMLFELADSQPVDLVTLLSRVHQDERAAVSRGMNVALVSGQAYDQEVRLALPSGSPRWIVARGRAGAGADATLRGVAIDVTERVRAEQQAARQRNELAHLSRVATVGALAGSLAHEINQPLMAILANAEAGQSFLRQRNADFPELRDILADIVEDDKRAGEVIRRLRLLLRKGEVQRAPIDMKGVVDDVLRLVHNDLLNRGVTASREVAEGLPAVLADRIQMQQVLLNLIVNACDAMEVHGDARQLRIRARVAGEVVEVAVADTGPGISADGLERIFEPFVTTKEHGMGLGLSICEAIVSAHGGRIWAESSGGHGAIFRFTVPAVPEPK